MPKTRGTTGDGRDPAEPARVDTGPPMDMTPAAALKRHLDWLDYALGAARAEETWRAGRLEKASKSNRDKRIQRLAEVREEIEELTALLLGIRDLEARAAAPGPAAKAPATRTARRRGAAPRPAGTAPLRRSRSAPSAAG